MMKTAELKLIAFPTQVTPRRSAGAIKLNFYEYIFMREIGLNLKRKRAMRLRLAWEQILKFNKY